MVRGLRVRPGGEEQFRGHSVVVIRGPVERRGAIGLGRLRGSFRVQKLMDARPVSLLSGVGERRICREAESRAKQVHHQAERKRQPERAIGCLRVGGHRTHTSAVLSDSIHRT